METRKHAKRGLFAAADVPVVTSAAGLGARGHGRPSRPLAASLAALVLLSGVPLLPAAEGTNSGPNATYTTNADFDQGTLVNVGHNPPASVPPFPPDQIQLTPTYPFNFIWIAVSGKGTVVRINTLTGDVLGEYKTAPDGMDKDPSRTTVDLNGGVWVTNRAEGSINPATGAYMGSVVHIGNPDNGGCRTPTPVTSTGLNNILAWTNAGGVDTDGGVDTAADECILHFVRTHSTNNRHLSITPDNDVWVSGHKGPHRHEFDLVSGSGATAGTIVRHEPAPGSQTYLGHPTLACGGYGGVLDDNGVLWSATNGALLRWNTLLPMYDLGTGAPNYECLAPDAYGVCLDSQNNVWTTWRHIVHKWSGAPGPVGVLLGSYDTHDPSILSNMSQGCAVDKNDHVWIAHGKFGLSTVAHLDNNGNWIGNVPTLSAPTGASVDAENKVWVTDFAAQKAQRIDPGPMSSNVGTVDFTTVDLGGTLYDYSDMTGSTLNGAPIHGTWTVVHDTTVTNAPYGTVSWHGVDPGNNGYLRVFAQTSSSPTFTPITAADQVTTSGGQLPFVPLQYIKLTVQFKRADPVLLQTIGDTPILFDISIDLERPGSPCITPPGDFLPGGGTLWEYGDAPDDSHGAVTTLYTSPGSTSGNFPSLGNTVHTANPGQPGARHLLVNTAWLGDAGLYGTTHVAPSNVGDIPPGHEADADLPPDSDGLLFLPNIQNGVPDKDYRDAGLLHGSFPANGAGRLSFRVTTNPGITDWAVNVLIDWNFDGRWAGVDPKNGAPEWAVVNYRVSVPLAHSHRFESDLFPVGSAQGTPWVRVTLTRDPIDPANWPNGWDGSVPKGVTDVYGKPAFPCGETEDYCEALSVVGIAAPPSVDVAAPTGILCQKKEGANPCPPGTRARANIDNIRAGSVTAFSAYYAATQHSGLGFEPVAVSANGGGLDVDISHQCVATLTLRVDRVFPNPGFVHLWSAGPGCPDLGTPLTHFVPGIGTGEYLFTLEWVGCDFTTGADSETVIVIAPGCWQCELAHAPEL